MKIVSTSNSLCVHTTHTIIKTLLRVKTTHLYNYTHTHTRMQLVSVFPVDVTDERPKTI